MTIQAGQVSVNTSEVLIYQADADGAELVIHNDEPGGGSVVYLGPSGVTTSTGFHFSGSETVPSLKLKAHDAVYGIAAAGPYSLSYIATT